MSEDPITETPKGANPTIAIMIAIAIAFIMVMATTINFLRSSAYTTVKQIQIGIQAVAAVSGGDLDITSPINAIDIDNYAVSINQRLDIIDDYADFGPEVVSDTTLGL